ncbi:membrane protein [Klebsiella pneumoniae]|uniref:Membrane protein n=1 Tax=Klebsiella pneumoniae TaxID=573 RepID=A0A377TWL0_KLEPN|nr:membrane protein [Klebsiella pneumoniae]
MESIRPCAARRVSLNTRLMTSTVVDGKVRIALRSASWRKALPIYTRPDSFIISQKVMEPRLMRGFIVGGPVGDFELLLCHGTVCVVGKMRESDPSTQQKFDLFNKANRLEKEVDYVNKASFGALKRHYDTLARLRVVLSDREAWGYLSIGLLVSALFSMTIIRMSMESGINAGHIYSVMTYMWMFATSLDDAPQLLEKFSQLRDIGKRVSTDDETSLSGKPC